MLYHPGVTGVDCECVSAERPDLDARPIRGGVLAHFYFIIRNFPFFWHRFSETGGGDRGLMKEGRKEGRQAGKGRQGGWGRGRNLLVKHTECQQSVGKRLVTRGQCAHSSATGEECAGHSPPQNRQCSFGPSTLCTAIVSAGTLFARILCPLLDFGGPPLFRTSRQGPPVQSGHSRLPQTAARPGDQAEVTPSRLPFQPRHHRCLSV